MKEKNNGKDNLLPGYIPAGGCLCHEASIMKLAHDTFISIRTVNISFVLLISNEFS